MRREAVIRLGISIINNEHEFNKPVPVGRAGKNVIKGVAVSPGIAVGSAVVVQNPEDLKRVNPDSILICPQMSPVYSIVFQMVRGIISERGSILSTTATLARENGLPAVTGVQSALQIISDGDLIWMDGTNGNVQIILNA